MDQKEKTYEEVIKELHDIQIKLNALEELHRDEEERNQSLIDLAKSEEEGRNNTSRLELAVDAVDMAWWDMDITTGSVTFHKRKAEMLGYDPERFKHYSDFTALVHPDDYEGVMAAMTNHFKGLVPTYETEYRILTSSGDYRWFYDIGTIVKKGTDGAPLKIIGFVIDITRRKQNELNLRLLNEDLQKVNAEKDKFFSIIAHDLRGPLATLLQITQMLASGSMKLTESERAAVLNTLNKEVKSSYNLLENLLEWSQMQRGIMVFNPLDLRLRNLVDESLLTLNESVRYKGISMIIDIEDEMKVKADYYMLQAIIRNLASNAIKFTKRGGTITISAKSTEKDGVQFSVKDTGIGMSNELRESLFRIVADTRRKGTNNEPTSGLGLMLCKEFVEKHGGKIWVESEEGKGSVFRFSIP
jgi:PAS domain S-box-containing protein